MLLSQKNFKINESFSQKSQHFHSQNSSDFLLKKYK